MTADLQRRNDAIEELNDALGAAEHALAGLNLGVAAEVPLDDRPAHDRIVLQFKKVNSAWILQTHHAFDGSCRPLQNSSVATRMMAAKMIPVLHQALLEAHGASIVELEASTTDLVAFVSRVAR